MDVRLIQVVGGNLPVVIRDRINILEFMVYDGLLSKFYEKDLGLNTSNRWIGRMARQVAHRYPHMHIFEIGKRIHYIEDNPWFPNLLADSIRRY